MHRPAIFFCSNAPLVGLEMVRDAFLAPNLSRRVPQKRNFVVKWLRDLTPHHEGRPREYDKF